MRPLPGPLAGAAGVTVAEYDLVGADDHKICTADGKIYSCSQWCDMLELESAEALAWYEGEFFVGKPAVAMRMLGKGRII